MLQLITLRLLRNRTRAHYKSHITLEVALNIRVLQFLKTENLSSERIFAGMQRPPCAASPCCVRETALSKFGMNTGSLNVLQVGPLKP